MPKICPVTGKTFEVAPAEMELRKKLGIEGEPSLHPIARWQILGAFWQHWALHKRKCDKTGKQIVSVFSQDCPYPVWHKDEWIKHADPPSAEVDLTKPIFPQMWELFRCCPIAHNVGTGNENCEYTDDWWYSKNCYLCHSGLNDEDLRYCYRVFNVKNSQFGVFSYDSERSVDLINSHLCFRSVFTLNCWQCTESAFLYDCRNCNHCFFCTNLRNKSYCFANQQLTKEEYKKRLESWDLRSRAVYEHAKKEFGKMLKENAWHRAIFMDQCQECGDSNYIYSSKGCTNCFFVDELEDCMHVFRGFGGKDCLDTVCAAVGSELVYGSTEPQDKCYDVKFGYNVMQCKYMEYCAQCFQCKHCFGCCGLVGKEYHIFNKPYEPKEFERKKAEVIAAMKKTGEYGQFFPPHFAANPYEESLAGFVWPMMTAEGKKRGFRMREREEHRESDTRDASEVPDRSDHADESVTTSPYWDPVAGRPFQILQEDVVFAQDLKVPLPYTYYMRRLQENFRLIPFNGELRTMACGKCKKETQTSWPKEYDGRILCEACYLKEVY
ncbi:MAG TPA: hypothetical protein DEB30_03400 [Candidatus Peribacter riflensis]|uniref:GATA-type domain-containing protein n=1 Tax=Candidatus Peribacter riflensis TaxID=1735162 RepID=A0A0S1SK61_9BACT|nr:MAG: hypothetical protein PeribacterA2_0694 [Candidatus Peribacter riflensis]OGJ79014.1 MAG: hypothetical protein A2398_04935 [Candidatus Peribacteria bacterium RIFOXYB1_FULL_57_12]OGJ80200.1 MAG: hypothetical protein A2412_04590 [Candidatus Peribacteria bacterium RIFOXYC1_FULL_58_8]ALM11164.1 MAG: hypothetical protein PeribacterB2_0695 [Candidatus Peribacter riflensis]ALM12267.1 MAG: hypothetical protein PeribacterC2_0695 [Candidatus Peribacter riflensis]